jgi:hypothetical protein
LIMLRMQISKPTTATIMPAKRFIFSSDVFSLG